MKKKLTAAVIALAVCLALLLAFAIYITMNDPSTAPSNTTPDTQVTIQDTKEPGETTESTQNEELPGRETDHETEPEVTEAMEPESTESENPTEPEVTVTNPADPEETVTMQTEPSDTELIEPNLTESAEDGSGEGNAAEGLQGENELPMEPFE